MTQQQAFNPEQDRLAPAEPMVQRITEVELAAQAVRAAVPKPDADTSATPDQYNNSVPYVAGLAPQPVNEGLATSEQVENNVPYIPNSPKETTDHNQLDAVEIARANIRQLTEEQAQ